MNHDVIIIGGGLIGMMTAYELQHRGQQVAIIDQHTLGQQASVAGGGILASLSPWAETEASRALYQLSAELYPALCQHLEEHTGEQTGYSTPGMVLLDPPQGEDFTQWLGQQSEIQILDESTLRTLVPYSEDTQGWLNSNTAQIENGKFIESLKHYLVQTGVVVHEQCAVREFQIEQQRLKSITTDYGVMNAGQFVLATGAWSGNEDWNLGIKMTPVRGQMIAYQLTEEHCSHIILKAGRYTIPRPNHCLIVGSTVEEVGFDCSITDEARVELMMFAESLFPSLRGQEPVAQWSGLRPKSDQDNPLIGHHPKIMNLLINTGHFRNGILAAPASAQLLVDIMMEQTPNLDAQAFRPAVREEKPSL